MLRYFPLIRKTTTNCNFYYYYLIIALFGFIIHFMGIDFHMLLTCFGRIENLFYFFPSWLLLFVKNMYFLFRFPILNAWWILFVLTKFHKNFIFSRNFKVSKVPSNFPRNSFEFASKISSKKQQLFSSNLTSFTHFSRNSKKTLYVKKNVEKKMRKKIYFRPPRANTFTSMSRNE